MKIVHRAPYVSRGWISRTGDLDSKQLMNFIYDCHF